MTFHCWQPFSFFLANCRAVTSLTSCIPTNPAVQFFFLLNRIINFPISLIFIAFVSHFIAGSHFLFFSGKVAYFDVRDIAFLKQSRYTTANIEMSNTRNLNTKQNGSLLFKISGYGQASFHENTFLELFLPNAPLHYLAEHIFGIVTHNYQHKIFNVTLLPTSEAQLPQIVQRFNKPTPLKTQSGNELLLEVRYHSPPTQTVTLHPVPHGITTEEILAFTNKWEELSAHEYGRHKTIRAFRNSFLHLQIKNLKINEMPERIIINKHFVAVLAPGPGRKVRLL